MVTLVSTRQMLLLMPLLVMVLRHLNLMVAQKDVQLVLTWVFLKKYMNTLCHGCQTHEYTREYMSILVFCYIYLSFMCHI